MKAGRPWLHWWVWPVLACGIAAAPSEPPNYRIDDYNAPTPATLQGATVIDTDQARGLWETHQSVFIDVLPRPPRPAGLPASTIWRPRPRWDIPGSIWLPDTGYGALAPFMEGYFRDGLEAASQGDHDRLMVFYCKADCWMSWNAAKRAMTYGYTHVLWYPDGSDGWVGQGLPIEQREPVRRPGTTE
jgi:PQQ-dependent catabolism-associated CXXCW motif protein